MYASPAESDDPPEESGAPALSPVESLLWDDAAFAKRVRAAAAEKGWRLYQLAQAAGVSEAWLRHKPNVTGRSVEHILRVAAALEIDPAELMGLEDIRKSGLRRLGSVISFATHLYTALHYRETVTDEDMRVAFLMLRDLLDSGDNEPPAP